MNCSHAPSTHARFAALIAAGLSVAACEQHVVSYNGLLSGLPNSQQSLPLKRNLGDYKDPTRVSESSLVVEDKTKEKKLVARTGRHLMIHIYNTVDEGDSDLFVREVLSSGTKQAIVLDGRSPTDYFNLLRSHQRDLQALFSAMPMGENTPGMFMRPVGNGVQRVRVDGIAAKNLYWDGFDMVMEGGNWKLVGFTGGERWQK
ncbi:MAG: hypothetical protein JSR77_12645 [Planctomycetes bacterium]|nr:hypothetical protein [Planctomycetota bacterium]